MKRQSASQVQKWKTESRKQKKQREPTHTNTDEQRCVNISWSPIPTDRHPCTSVCVCEVNIRIVAKEQKKGTKPVKHFSSAL